METPRHCRIQSDSSCLLRLSRAAKHRWESLSNTDPGELRSEREADGGKVKNEGQHYTSFSFMTSEGLFNTFSHFHPASVYVLTLWEITSWHIYRRKTQKTSSHLIARTCMCLCVWLTVCLRLEEAAVVLQCMNNHQWASPLEQILTFAGCIYVCLHVSTCVWRYSTKDRNRPTLLFQQWWKYKREEKATRENTVKICPPHDKANWEYEHNKPIIPHHSCTGVKRHQCMK